MKHTLAVLLVFLLLIGTVSAVTLNPSTGRITVTAAPTSQATLSPDLVAQIATTPVPSQITVNVESVPTGSTVMCDGYLASITPTTILLLPGEHTIVIKRPLYEDYTTTLHLTGDMPTQYIVADLKLKDISHQAAQISITPTPTQAVSLRPDSVLPAMPDPTIPAVTPEPTAMPGQPGSDGVTLPVPAGVTLVTTTIVPVVCPNDEWACFTPEKAAYLYGTKYLRYGDTPCGYLWDTQEPQYCYKDLEDPKDITGSLVNGKNLLDTDKVYYFNGTEEHLIKLAVINAEMKSAEKPNPLQGFFDLFSMIMGGGNKPESRLEIVGLNPQPEPPAKRPDGT